MNLTASTQFHTQPILSFPLESVMVDKKASQQTWIASALVDASQAEREPTICDAIVTSTYRKKKQLFD